MLLTVYHPHFLEEIGEQNFTIFLCAMILKYTMTRAAVLTLRTSSINQNILILNNTGPNCIKSPELNLIFSRGFSVTMTNVQDVAVFDYYCILSDFYCLSVKHIPALL